MPSLKKEEEKETLEILQSQVASRTPLVIGSGRE
jgi:hypothetical protein